MDWKPKNPVISVVIPAYNEELFVGECLNSLKSQDFSDSYEIILVDNNSSDRTAEIARQHGAKIIFEPRQGVCSARQAGTEASRGKIIVSTDADTVFPSDWLSKIHAEFQKNPDVVAVAGEYNFINAPGWARIYTKMMFGTVNKIFRWKGKVVYAPASNFAFKKEFAPGYNTALTQGGDELDILARLQNKGKVVFLKDNKVDTSNRRLSKGFFYNFLVTFLSYYILDYFAGKIAGKSVLGPYPAIRVKNYRPSDYKLSSLKLSFVRPAALVLAIGIIFAYSAVHANKSQAAIRLVKYAGSKIAVIEDKAETRWQRR